MSGDIFMTAIAQMANTFMETPHAQGVQHINRIMEGAARGDVTYINKIIAKAIEKAGSPHMTARKQIIEGFLPDKQAAVDQRFGKGFRQKGKPWENVGDDLNPFTTGLNLLNRSYQHDVIGLMANLIYPLALGMRDGDINSAKNTYYESRQAIWYGKPGEPFQSEFTGALFPFQTILGRHWAFPNKLKDPVYANMALHLIKGANHRLYASDKYGGIIINDKVLNTFNHYLQNEYQEYSLDGTKMLTGAYDMFLETINSPYYKTEGVDPTSPYKMPRPPVPWYLEPLIGKFFQPDVNWNNTDNPKRNLLQNRRDTMLEGAKESWYLQSIKHYNGEIELRFPMPRDMLNQMKENRELQALEGLN